MAGTLNKVMLIGNLGKDPEIMHFENGGSLVKFPLATSETYTNREGQRVTNTEWHNVVINAKGLVDVAHKYLKRGHKVYLEGRIKTRKWHVGACPSCEGFGSIMGAFHQNKVPHTANQIMATRHHRPLSQRHRQLHPPHRMKMTYRSKSN